MMDPNDPRANGVPILGNGVRAGQSGLVVELMQPDGNSVVVPLEMATFHVLVEVREHLREIRVALTGESVVDEAEAITTEGEPDDTE